MRRPLILATLATIALSVAISPAALADTHGREYDRAEHRDDRRLADPHYDRRPAQLERYDHSHARYHVVRYVPPREYRQHVWYRGTHLPRAYYAPRYVVRDYSAYRLRPPPRGYHWVRVDNDVVLAAMTTGLVLQVVNNIFY